MVNFWSISMLLVLLEYGRYLPQIRDVAWHVVRGRFFSYISRTWLPIQTTNTYLESAWLTGSNSTKNIEILQKLTILEPFYGIRIILDICAKLSVFSHIFPVLDFRSKQYMHIWNLHDWLVLTVPITLKCSKNWLF